MAITLGISPTNLDILLEYLGAKLHKTEKCLEVFETSTTGNATLQKWKRQGKRHVCVCILKNTLSCKKNIMTHINDILEGKPCLY